MQKLKSQQLSDFINKTDCLSLHHHHQNNIVTSTAEPTALNPNQSVNYQKYSLFKLDNTSSSGNNSGGNNTTESLYDEEEAPLLFVGKESLQLDHQTKQLQDIIHSYKIFKELYTEDQFAEFVNEEHVDFTSVFDFYLSKKKF